MRRRLARIVFAAILASTAARADFDVEVQNGDSVSGTIAHVTDADVIRFRVPAGAAISAKAKSSKKAPSLHLDLRGPAGDSLMAAEGSGAAITGVAAASSGLYSLDVAPDAAASGDFTITVSWKARTSFSTTASAVAPDGAVSFGFAADAGATAMISVKKAKGSRATGALVSLTGPDAAVVPLTGTKTKLTLTSGGDQVLSFKNAGTALGDLTASVKLKAPKPSKRKVTLTANVIGPGGQAADFATASVLGSAGGTVVVPAIGAGGPGSPISGSSVVVPPGALGAPTTIVVGTAPPIASGSTTSGAGPTVFFGPEGTQFEKSHPATVTIPYDRTYDTSSASLLIFTRDAKGKLTLVPPPYEFDYAAHTVSFPTSHFSSFRALAPGGGGPILDVLTYASVANVQDVTIAYEPPGNPNLAEFFTAEGASRVVGVLRLDTTGFQMIHETWAGGGNQTADGTPRLQFQFADDVTSVYSVSDESTYVATKTQVFKIAGDGLVHVFAGTGQSLDGGDGGAATAATFVSISSVIVAGDGTVYVCDNGAHRIRVVDPLTSKVDAWAGTGSAGLGTDGTSLASTTFIGPNDMDFTDDGGLYVADLGRVRKLVPPNPLLPGGANVTVAGAANGAVGTSGDDGPALSAQFRAITGIAVAFDPSSPNSKRLVVCDGTAHTVRLVDLTNDKVRLLVGQPDTPGYSGDPSASPGLADSPTGVLALPSQIVFADTGNNRVRTRIFPAGYP
jgi:hypothetical protein